MYASYSGYLKNTFNGLNFKQPQPATIAMLSFKKFALSEWKQALQCFQNDEYLERDLYLSLINGEYEGSMAGQEKEKTTARRIFAKRRLNQNECRKRKKYNKLLKASD